MMKKYKTRNGKIIVKKDSQQVLLDLLYNTTAGRAVVKKMAAPALSEWAGYFCSSIASRFMIVPFIKKSGIDMSQYKAAMYSSYNDFFTRQIRPECRPIDMTPSALISPCDSKLSIYKTDQNSVFSIKNSYYSVNSLVKCKSLADKYCNGYCMIFRLEIDDYHRYIYIDNGNKTKNRHISGFYHTVNPIALESVDIYRENTREVTMLNTENFGEVLQIEIGAMMVGRILNHHQESEIRRGQEKGMFEFGGSTIVLLFKENAVVPDSDILKNTAEGFETIVKMGEKIGSQRDVGSKSHFSG